VKPVEYYKDREQTYLKHFFLERYLETVAYHIGFSQKEFVFVDCFSGPWRAADACGKGVGRTVPVGNGRRPFRLRRGQPCPLCG